jgi:hypothetical protein
MHGQADEIARQFRALKQRPAPQVAAPAPATDVMHQIRKLGELRDAGLLTAEEFDSKKAELLGRL